MAVPVVLMAMIDLGPKPPCSAAKRHADTAARPLSPIDAAIVVEIEIAARGLLTDSATVPLSAAIRSGVSFFVSAAMATMLRAASKALAGALIFIDAARKRGRCAHERR